MEVSLQMLLWLCPLIFISGFIDAIAGGGGLISLPAYLFAGLPPHSAYATNKFSSTIGTSFSVARFIKSGNIHWPVASVSIIGALIGSYGGARLVLILNPQYLQYFLLVALPVVAMFLWTRKGILEREEKGPKTKNLVFWAFVSAIFIGGYDGFFGPGTGTFFILVHTSILGFGVKVAAGNAKVSNFSSNIAALFAFLVAGQVAFGVGVLASLCNIAGHWIGSGIAIKKGAHIIRPIMIVVFCLLFIKIILSVLGY